MHDVAIELKNQPGELARLGEILGEKGISINGGGVFVSEGKGIAHFLFEDGNAAKAVLEGAGIQVIAVHRVLIQRLDQELPGQLGAIARRMADAGVNIEVQYSDHDNQLIIVADDFEKGRKVSEDWERERRRRVKT